MSSLKQRTVTPSGTTLTISTPELARLHDHAREGYPFEVVGILAGSTGTVSRVVPLHNERATNAEKRYRVSGLVVMKAEMALNAEGLEVLGYYHSHPDHPAMYSDTDRDLSLPNMSYLITAVAQAGDGAQIVDTRVWRLREDRSEMDAETLIIDAHPTNQD